METSRRLLTILLVSLGCVGCDQVTKSIALDTLAESAPWSFLGGTIRLQLAYNTGSFLGLGGSLPESWRHALFVAGVCLAIAGLLAWSLLAAKLTPASVVALALMISGGASNLLDRLVHDGRVVDFINVDFGPLRTGIFNVADVAITSGALFLLAGGFRKTR